MGRLIIDITELAAWRGKPTGVPRVMDELASRFAANRGVCFVIWNGHRQAFQKVDYSRQQRAEAEAQTTRPAASPSLKYASLIATANRIKSRSKLAGKALSVPERTARKLLKPKPVLDTHEIISPRQGDQLLVLADWHGSDMAFVDKLTTLKQAGIKLIQVSYDMLPIVTPQYSGHATETFTRYVNMVYPICDAIIAISENTRQDIETYLDYHKLPVPRLKTMRLGEDFTFAKATRPEGQFFKSGKADAPFLLCVGTIEARKNHTLLYYTYKLARQRGITLPPLVIVGRRGWLSDDIYEVITNDPQTKDSIIFLHNTSDGELSWLYEHCLFTIYPSFYEGWGLPIAESITHKKPCLSSNTSSMPEIAGDLIDYFSPLSADECLAAIRRILQPKELIKATKRLDGYHTTSWDDTYAAVKAILEEVYE